ncbi:MAG: TIGR04552 family protein [Bdellovibrionaceae bacterium]|nr:TIGR04552 family protein [Pseudobdellovibrionaceae bacterium]
MSQRFDFDRGVLDCLAGGQSAIDLPALHLRSEAEAKAFLRAYGFDPSNPEDIEKMWAIHRRAVVLLVERLGVPEDSIPVLLRERKELGEIWRLLVYASSNNPAEQNIQKHACALLRAMHVFVHVEKDLFGFFSEEIQRQILTPFQNAIYHDGTNHRIYLKSQDPSREMVELKTFEIKPYKGSASAVVKLLAKRDALAVKIFDRMGVRFVCHGIFDCFQTIRFLTEENILAFPHLVPDQSSNNLYPVDLFERVCGEMKQAGRRLNHDEMEEILERNLRSLGNRAGLFRKVNEQSADNFRFIKFITRKLIRTEIPGKGIFSFFFPYEVQIMDASSWETMRSGPTEHTAYKKRQNEAALRRLYPGG